MTKLQMFLLAAGMLSLPTQHAAAEWVSIGKGVYYEGLLTYYGEEMGVPRGLSWTVDIEEDSDTKGLYRLAPYSGNNPMADIFGYPDDTYMVIHAENPGKVWMEDFDSYEDTFCFTHMIPESGWEGEAAEYGSLTDGTISFPAMCMATVDITDPDLNWHSANREGEFRIVLPEASSGYEDYSLYLDYKYCGENNLVPVTITAGPSTASIKYMLTPGLVDADSENETNADLDRETMDNVAANGIETGDGLKSFECKAQGLHSLLVVTLDADGNARSGKVAYIYGDVSDPDEWKSWGNVLYNEDFFAGYYEDLPQAELYAELQGNKNIPGYYRLVNPYSTYEYNFIENHAGHNHYIYIHAENPDAVWIENSPIGVDFGDGYGEGRVTSNVAIALEYGATLDEAIEESAEEIGRVNSSNVIEFPRWGLWVGQSGFYNGYWTSTAQNFRVHLPEGAGIDSVMSDSDDNTAPEYYNLQGMRIERPAQGLYIERRGSTVTKRVAR